MNTSILDFERLIFKSVLFVALYNQSNIHCKSLRFSGKYTALAAYKSACVFLSLSSIPQITLQTFLIQFPYT